MKLENHSEREHADRSPSSLEKRALCAKWQTEDKGDTYHSADGTACHEAFEAYLKGDPTKFGALASDLQWFVTEVMDYVMPRIAGAEKIILETRVYADHPLLKKHSHGTPDLVTITGTVGQMFDEKYGRRPVKHAKDNLQGYAYAIAVFDTHPELTELTVHFVVPRVSDCTSHHTFYRDKDYDRLLATVLSVVEKSLDPRAKATPVWSACAYCGGRLGCKAFTLVVGASIATKEESITGKGIVAAMSDDSPESLHYRMKVAKLAEAWGKDVQADLLTKALDGAQVEGYELRFSKGRTTAKNFYEVKKALNFAAMEGLSDQLEFIATVPLTELKKLASSKLDGATNKEKEGILMKALIEGDALKTGDDTPYLFRLNEQK
jgi:hypothetical protein